MSGPKAANVASAEAQLGAMLGDNSSTAAGPVTRVVHQTGDQIAAAAELEGASRIQQQRGPKRGADRTRDVMGRFNADGTPKAKAKEGDAMARAEAKAPPDVTAESPSEAATERTPDKQDPPAKDTKKPPAASAIADRARAKLEALRADRAAKAQKAQAQAREQEAVGRSTSELAATQRELDSQLEAAKAARARLEGATTDPVAAFQEMGLDPSDAFLKLAEAAKQARDPETRIRLMREAYDAEMKSLRGEIDSIRQERQAEKDSAIREREIGKARETASKETCPYSHAYIAAEAKRQGLSVDVLWEKAIEHAAKIQRDAGKTPTYKSIAAEIEDYCQEVVLELVASLPPDKAGATEKATAAKSPEEPIAPEKKGRHDIGNEVASSRVSGARRRLSLQERQKRAEKFLA